MDTQTKEVMEEALQGQHVVHAMYELYQSSLQEGQQSFADWLYYIIDVADVTVNIDDFTDGEHVIDYDGYYCAVYNQVKTYLKNKMDYALDNWIQTDQPITT